MERIDESKQCPLCGTYLPSLGHLLSELDAAEARVADGEHCAYSELLDIKRALAATYPNYADDLD